MQATNAPLLRVSFSGDEDEWPCLGQVHEEEKIFLFYSLCPFVPSAARRAAMAEFVTRANANMIMGNFEMDLDSGRVRYKTSIDVQGDRLTPRWSSGLSSGMCWR